MEFNTVIGRNLLEEINNVAHEPFVCLLYTSDAADE